MKSLQLFLCVLILHTGSSSCRGQTDPNKYYGLEDLKKVNPNKVYRFRINVSTITDVPKVLKKCTNIEYIDFRGCRIHNIPQFFSKFAKLETLNLSDNDLDEIPDGVFLIPHLKEILLYDNRITFFPATMKDLQDLESIHMSGPKVRNLDILRYNPKLNSFGSNEMGLDEFPAVILNFPKTKYIYLWENNITSIPEELASFDSLEYLNVSTNKLTRFPKELAGLKKLESLLLADNEISEVDSTIGLLDGVEVLYLSENPLDDIPDAIADMEHLEYCNARKTNISEERQAQLRKMAPDVYFEF